MGTGRFCGFAESHRPRVDANKVGHLLRLGEPFESEAKWPAKRPKGSKAPTTNDFIEGAEAALGAAKVLRTAGNGTWAFVSAYCSMFHTARALVSNAGLFISRDTDYLVLMRFAANYNRVTNFTPGLKEEVMWLAQLSMKDQRNDIVHSGLNHVRMKTVNEVITHAEDFLAKARAAIRQSRPPQN